MIISAHRADAVGVEEHVLGAAEADPFGAEAARRAGVGGGVGIGAHAHRADRVGPAHQRREIAGQLRLDRRHLAEHDLAGRAVDGDDVAGLDHGGARRHRARGVVDAQIARAGDAGPAHAARDDGGVAGHAAARSSGCPWRRACRGCPRGWSRSRTRITASPRAAASASSAENTTLPEAAPGEAGRPRARIVVFALGSSVGWSSWSSEAGSMRRIASSRSITPSSTISTAILSAAGAVRLPVRVCSM